MRFLGLISLTLFNHRYFAFILIHHHYVVVIINVVTVNVTIIIIIFSIIALLYLRKKCLWFLFAIDVCEVNLFVFLWIHDGIFKLLRRHNYFIKRVFIRSTSNSKTVINYYKLLLIVSNKRRRNRFTIFPSCLSAAVCLVIIDRLRRRNQIR